MRIIGDLATAMNSRFNKAVLLTWPFDLPLQHIEGELPDFIPRFPTDVSEVVRRAPSEESEAIRRSPSETSSVIRRG